MARRKHRRGFGMAHSSEKASRASAFRRTKKLKVNVTVSRSNVGTYLATACVVGHRGPLARCSPMRSGASPTKAAGNALRELGENLKG